MTDAQASALAALEREYGNAELVNAGPFPDAIPPDCVVIVCRVEWPQGKGYMARLLNPEGQTIVQAKGLPANARRQG